VCPNAGRHANGAQMSIMSMPMFNVNVGVAMMSNGGVYGVSRPPPASAFKISVGLGSPSCVVLCVLCAGERSCGDDLDPAVAVADVLAPIASRELLGHSVLSIAPTSTLADAALLLLALLDGLDNFELLESRIL
jgi:hypothetical protein